MCIFGIACSHNRDSKSHLKKGIGMKIIKKKYVIAVIMLGVVNFASHVAVMRCADVQQVKSEGLGHIIDANTLLLEAVCVQNIDRIKEALALNANIEAVDREGNTVLHYPWVSSEIMQYLMDNGARVCVTKENRHKDTPLHRYVSMRNQDEKAIRLLLDNGAYVNAQDNSGRTPLHEVADVTVARILIEHKADVDRAAHDCYGKTPLHEAWKVEIVSLLLESKALIEKRNYSGHTPLQYACYAHKGVRGCMLQIIDVLLAHKADVEAKDNNGRAILEAAATAYSYGNAGGVYEQNLKRNISKLIRAGAKPFDFPESMKKKPFYLVEGMDDISTFMMQEFDALAREKGALAMGRDGGTIRSRIDKNRGNKRRRESPSR